VPPAGATDRPAGPARGLQAPAVVLAALAVRLGYVFQARGADPMFEFPAMDALFHHQWAQAIIRGGWLAEMPYFRAPLYPYFLALVYRLGGVNLLLPRLVQAGLGGLTALLTWLLARRLFGARAGLAAGLAAAGYPLLIYFDGELLIPALLVPLVLGGLLLLDQCRERDRWWWALPGAAFGLAALCRPNVLAFAALVPAWLLFEHRRRAWPKLLPYLGALVLVIAPVTVRNWVAGREFIPIAWQAGVNFAIGNNPESDGVTAVLPGTRKDWWGGFYDVRRLAEEAAGRPLGYSAIDRYWLGRGLAFWREQPARALGQTARKLYRWWSGYEVANNRDIYFFSRFSFLRFLIHRRPLFLFPFGLVVPLAAVGIYSTRRQWRRLLPHYLFLASYSLSFVAFFVTARYRLTLVPLLLAFAVAGAAGLVRAFRRGQGRAAALLLLLVLYVPLNLDLGGRPATNDAQNWTTLAGHEASQGRGERAGEYLARARAADSTWADQYLVAGLIARREGRPDRAEAGFRRAIALDPANADYHVYLGDLYYDQRRPDSAEANYRRALALDPHSAFGRCHYGNVLFDRGEYAAAREEYATAARLIPDYAVALFNTGLADWALGDSARARESWTELIRVAPGHPLSDRARDWLESR
jgi:4-amino-4-deoxy-L-arabinose transferase-like glycosyltransferase